MHKARGFTLIELLVVILVIAVMSSLVVPAYAHFADRMRFDNITRQVQDLFAYARQHAVDENTVAILKYDAGSNTIAVSVTSLAPSQDQPVALSTGPGGMPQQAQPEPPQIVALGPDYAVMQFSVTPSTSPYGGGGAMQGSQAGGSNGQNKTIQFYADGTCDGAEVRLVSRAGYMAHMILMPAVGRLVLANDSTQVQP